MLSVEPQIPKLEEAPEVEPEPKEAAVASEEQKPCVTSKMLVNCEHGNKSDRF